ncbi:hypothetical protein TBLA_0C03030 [Henningerozyma blattae CBS 6284]|uniref:Amino acid transporter transmembrane domain-containing protein n=1 Tax=Henningerozyma blattae (strain ATCC 34711 / CBS 6284 / DSM 70876 / NBRC 10599 / NRRL Y-10934 / UCD 77-7) TaxID=1071380 RepID=I2H155_HENB6|nr:hypothetical protein TBLA_0C03030 [Tetrapisispora blattae CBS 6284]CCH60107.1 hypothetical protein TBLA_0C03030 [Tetrapisispora blattae CBS 6284]
MSSVKPRIQRSHSISGVSIASSAISTHTQDDLEETTPLMTHQEIRAPGGFRRSFILHRYSIDHQDVSNPDIESLRNRLPRFKTNKQQFDEYLFQLYGHFAGQDLSESDNEEEQELEPTPPSSQHNKSSTTKAILLLLKSFIGTGVLFLPKAFSNGGYVFSLVSLIICSLISYYCFILLLDTKSKLNVNGYGDLGLTLYGSILQKSILLSIVLSQLGFAAAYNVFTATNLHSLSTSLITNPPDFITIPFCILLQTFLFIPLSFTRNITKLSSTALIADLFIFIGLIYLYYYPIKIIATKGPDWQTMTPFNTKDWSLFIGTAIFTYEGIGLLIPIQESMKSPHHFKKSLILVLVIITLVFITIGLLGYSAFGSNVDTVLLQNFPQDNPCTSLVQLLYSLAILLSTPLQLFPAIKILENWIFSKDASGKYNHSIKWAKNYFRSTIVILTSLISYLGANDLNKFVALVGSFACIPLIYVYPPLLHYKATQLDNTFTWKTLLADFSLLTFGIITMIYTSLQTIILWGE